MVAPAYPERLCSQGGVCDLVKLRAVHRGPLLIQIWVCIRCHQRTTTEGSAPQAGKL